MTYISEKYQLHLLRQFLDSNFEDYLTEEKIYSAPVDIIAFDGTRVSAFELKSQNHKRGIAQAERNAQYSDYSYLCVWEEQVTDYLQERVQQKPIGLVSVGNEIDIVKESEYMDPSSYAKQTTIERFKGDV